MNVRELSTLLGAENIVEGARLDAEVSCGYACDLLSWVLAHGKPGMAWATVQTHVNVIAVSALMEMACVILTEKVEIEPTSLKKATDEGIPVLVTDKTAYEVCGLMCASGILPPKE